MSIENSFCLCDWSNTIQLWNSSESEDDFADQFFNQPTTEEIWFEDKIHRYLASWEIIEELSDWIRKQSFGESADWNHFCSAWKQLGLMESEEYHFDPINELTDEEESEVLFAALSSDSVKNVLAHLRKINPAALDQCVGEHGTPITVPFSHLAAAVEKALDPEKGLIIFAG
jgi:hypothetical protein